MKKGTEPNPVSRMRRVIKMAVWAALISTAPMAAGCYGRFPLTKAVYKLNGDLSDDRVIRSGVFWILNIIPIYWFAQLGDALVINLIEFWTNEKIEISSTEQRGDTTVSMQTSEDGSELRLTMVRKGETVGVNRFVRVGEGKFEVRDEANRVVGKVIQTEEGTLNLTDAKGKVLSTVRPEMLLAQPAM